MSYTGREIGVLHAHYQDRSRAEDAIERFKAAGFPGDAISIVLHHPEEAEELAHAKGIDTPASTMLGTGSGALIGGALGYLVGISAIAATGGGILLVAGPLVGLAAGAGIGHMLEGLRGALAEIGFSRQAIARHEALLREGKPLIVIHCLTRKQEEDARRIFSETGAEEMAFTPNREYDRDMVEERPG